jgi:ABC-type phosphate/phosphonate transport system substrate-binding protein
MRAHFCKPKYSWVFLAVWLACCPGPAALAEEGERSELTIVVMDPLALPLACDCVQGYAQRRYGKLGEYLQRELGCEVRIAFSEDLPTALQLHTGGKADLIIGKDSIVRYDAAALKREVRPLAALTGEDGSTTQHGLFVVPRDAPAATLSDLKGYTVLFGPVEAEEKHAAALAALTKAGVPVPAEDALEIRAACSEGACDILDADFGARGAAVISSYAKPLLEGCGTVEKGALKVVGRTADVPFVTVYATDSVNKPTGDRIRAALLAAREDADLCSALETRDGFVSWKTEKKK